MISKSGAAASTTFSTINGNKLIEQLGFGDVSLLPDVVKNKVNFSNQYRVVAEKERDEVILSVISSLINSKFRVSGENNNAVWEKGWGEVLSVVEERENFTSDALIPQYFNRECVYRLFGDYVFSESPTFAFDIDQVIRSLIFAKYLIQHKRIVEIGSGTGNSQYLLAQMCPPETELVGSDWATKSQDILSVISKKLNRPIKPVLFNMLTLDGYDDLQIDSDTVVFTVHTLEQLGKSYKPLLQKLLDSKPALCVHSEPIKEMYDSKNLMDYLALVYHDVRNYLDGWLTDLKELESQNKVEIMEQRRIHVGNKYHEAYSLVVWRPL